MAEITSNNWWDLDMNKLVILLLPIHWRKPKMVAFMQALAAPLRELHYSFVRNRIKNMYRIRHNFMICYMEAALNDEFDPAQRRIRIDEPEMYANRYIYTSGEQQPKYLGTMYLRSSAELEGGGFDFTVNMNGAVADIHDIRALVDFYKLAGPRYNINMPISGPLP